MIDIYFVGQIINTALLVLIFYIVYKILKKYNIIYIK